MSPHPPTRDGEENDVYDTTEALAVVDHDTPMPVFRGEQMNEALNAYRQLQKALDKSMPDQIMTLDGKPFRKKGYWRAIAVAFNLTVEPIEERREVQGAFDDGRENFGYVVTYRASTRSGRSEAGDGACFAIEKAKRGPNQWATLPAQATEHNVRSHAHTRAFNRAVSNLVGFGEVSAEEVDRDYSQKSNPEPPLTPTSGTAEAAPVGYHYLAGYRINHPWHEAYLLGWDAQGGRLKVSTKYENVAKLMAKAANESIPVKADVTSKKDRPGEAYLNKLELYKPPPTDAEIDAEIAKQDMAKRAGEVA